MSVNLDSSGNVTNNVIGNVVGNVIGNLIGNVNGNLKGDVKGNLIGNVTGDLTGDVKGNLVGNVKGNVIGDLIGNVTGDLTGDVKGNVMGDLIGNVTGNVNGNLVGNVTGNVKSNSISASSIVSNTSDINVMKINGKMLIDSKRNITANSLTINNVKIDPNQYAQTAQTTYNKFIEDNNDVIIGNPGDIDNETGLTYSRNLNLIYDKNTDPFEILCSVGNTNIDSSVPYLRTSIYSPINNTLYMGGKFSISKNNTDATLTTILTPFAAVQTPTPGVAAPTIYNNVIGYDFSGNKFVSMTGTTNTGLIGNEVRKFVFDDTHNKIYCTGQFGTDGSGNILNNVAVFDISTNAWSPLKDSSGNQHIFGLATGTIPENNINDVLLDIPGEGEVEAQTTVEPAIDPTMLSPMLRVDPGGKSGIGVDLALDIANQYLYVIGEFSHVCNVSVNNIAVYDITKNKWYQVGTGLDYYTKNGLDYGNNVLSNTMVLDTSGSNLYFCNPSFIQVNGYSGQLIQYTRTIGDWDSGVWTMLDTLFKVVQYNVNCLEYNKNLDILYIGGSFYTHISDIFNKIAGLPGGMETTAPQYNIISYDTILRKLIININNTDPNSFDAYCIKYDNYSNLLFFSTMLRSDSKTCVNNILDLNTNTTISKYYSLPNNVVQYCTIGSKIVMMYSTVNDFGFYTFELTNSARIYDKNNNLLATMLIPFEQISMFYSNSLQKWMITDVKSAIIPTKFN